ncbi:MAG TPA: glycosyltransferase family 39 protein [Chloroflexia bacterium]|jgi:predicted membrane-bound mannosyltransferase
MKTERHRDRVQGPNTDASGDYPGSTATPDGSTGESVADGPPADGYPEMTGHEAGAELESGNGYASLEDGSGTEDGSAYDGNGHAVQPASPQVVLTLPKRKRRVHYVPDAPETPTDFAASEVMAPAEERVVSAPVSSTGVALPPKARRGAGAPPAQTQPVPAAVAEEPAEAVETESSTRRFHVHITVEGLLWAAFFALAILTRLWDLSNRGIHHDESLHAVYGNNLYNGSGYIHDPMMHGPLQFHLIAFMYWLFGTSEMSARMASAFCGIWVVMAPFFLRRQMGRVPALIASFLLLLSPGVLYFSRMAREDAIFSATEMLMIVGLWRFVSNRKPADFFIFAAGLSLMFTIKEASYLSTAVIVSFFALLFVIQSGYAVMAATAVYGALLGGLVIFMRGNMMERDASHQIIAGSGTMAPLPIIPDVGPRYDVIWQFMLDLFTHPLVLGAMFLTIAYLIALTILFRGERSRLEEAPPAAPVVTRTRVSVPERGNGNGGTLQTRVSRGDGNGMAPGTIEAIQPAAASVEAPGAASPATPYDPEAASELWDPRRLDPKPGSILGRYQAGSIPHLIGALFARPSVLLVGLAIIAAIYTVFYTVFFTDIPRGLISGFFGSLGYWMAQHGVERGSQPWYYYFLLIPLYEPIAVFFSLAGTVFFSWRGLRWLRNRKAAARYSSNPPRYGMFNVDRTVPFATYQSFLAAFLIWWLFGVTAIYSWAGEKMPWLMVHMVRPALLLASLFLGALLLSMMARRRERIEEAAAYDGRYVAYGPGTPSLASGGMMRSTLARLAQPGFQVAGALPSGGTTALDLQGGQVLAMSSGRGPQRQRPSAHTSAHSSARRGAPPPPPVPARRGGRGRGAAVAVARRQEPPWVAWNSPDSNFPALAFLTLFVLFAMSWAMTMNFQIALNNNFATWSWTWLWPGLAAALVIAFIAWVGPGRALRYLAVGLFSVFLLYEFRSAMMLSYFQPDVPKEMAVYVQTSPDVTRAMKEIKDYSVATTGRNDVKVLYDSDVSWPYSWYFHNFKNAQFIGGGEPQPAADVPIMVFGYDTKNSNTELLKNYTSQRYAMRWWFPEDWYKKNLISGLAEGQTPKTAPFATAGLLAVKLGDTFTKPDNQATLWKYLFFRETPQPLGSYDMLVFVRKDIAPYYHYLQYQPIPSEDIP